MDILSIISAVFGSCSILILFMAFSLKKSNNESKNNIRKSYIKRKKIILDDAYYVYIISEKNDVLSSNSVKHEIKKFSNSKNIRIDNDFISFGRDQRCDIIIKNNMVSQIQFIISTGKDNLLPTIMDMQTTNGTYVNGERLPSGYVKHLNTGDVISVGGDDYFCFEKKGI